LGKDVSKLVEGLAVAVAKRSKGRGCGWMKEGCNEISGGGSCLFGSRGMWHGDESREPSEGVSCAFAGCLLYPDGVAAIMVHSRSDVPTVDSMGSPRGANGRFLVAHHASSWRGKWHSVEVEGAMNLGVGRELGIDPRTSEEIERDEGLGEKTVPQVERKIGIGAAESGDEVVFEGSDGAFCGVATMEVRRD
jgi:hypothetical protein